MTTWREDTLRDPCPWMGHPRQAEFERSFAEHGRAMAACNCEWDGGYGDDGGECRRTPKLGCPTHTEEDRELGRILPCDICHKDFLKDQILEIADPDVETSLGRSESGFLYACEPCAKANVRRSRR